MPTCCTTPPSHRKNGLVVKNTLPPAIFLSGSRLLHHHKITKLHSSESESRPRRPRSQPSPSTTAFHLWTSLRTVQSHRHTHVNPMHPMTQTVLSMTWNGSSELSKHVQTATLRSLKCRSEELCSLNKLERWSPSTTFFCISGILHALLANCCSPQVYCCHNHWLVTGGIQQANEWNVRHVFCSHAGDLDEWIGRQTWKEKREE